MKKIINLLLKGSLLAYLLSFALGLYLLWTNQSGYQECAKVGGFFSLVLTAVVICEVSSSKRIGFFEKSIWIVSFLIFQILAGIAYFLVDRKVMNQQMELNQ